MCVRITNENTTDIKFSNPLHRELYVIYLNISKIIITIICKSVIYMNLAEHFMIELGANASNNQQLAKLQFIGLKIAK